MKNNSIQIVEYGFLHCNDLYQEETSKSVYVKEKFFNELKQFVLENKSEGSEFLKISHKKNYGEILHAQQFVGVLQAKDGTTLEILPKITDISENVEYNKNLFLKMLIHLKNSTFKNLNFAHLKSQKNFPLLEIFITLFCDEISNLIKKGIKSAYNTRKENSFFLKGQLLFKQQITKNFIHKEKFFIEYDEFSLDIPENQLLKSAINLLIKQSKSQKNISKLQEYLFVFEGITESKNIDVDFKKIKSARGMKHYIKPLQLAEMFLQHKYICPVVGSTLAFSLLFDMNKVFENYVAHCLKKSGKYQKVKTQVSQEYLVAFPNNKFTLQPDILLINFDNSKIIADTKWKKISEIKNISQSDMYQMFAYVKKYKVGKIQLIYPKHSDLIEKFCTMYFDKEKKLSVEILFFDIEKDELCS